MKSGKAAIILARMDSERFPGKALSTLCGKPLIEWCADALINHCQAPVILATSDRPVDHPLAEWGQSKGITVFRGSSDDVAQRIIDCGLQYRLQFFARINGDSPFVNPELISDAFQLAQTHNYDLVTNLVPRVFPYGISVEVLKFDTFRHVFMDPDKRPHREHITHYFYKNLQLFNYYCIPYDGGNDHDIRLTVDRPEDMHRMAKLLDQISGQPHSLEIIIETYRKIFRDK